MSNIDRAWTITKVAALLLVFAVVAAVSFVIAFGEDFG